MQLKYNFNKPEERAIKTVFKFTRENYYDKFYANHQNIRRKYDLMLIIKEVFYFFKNGCSYRNYRGPINYKSLNSYVLFFYKNNIFMDIYNKSLKQYIKRKSLKYLSIDTSFFLNKGCIIGRHLIAKNLKAKMIKRKLNKETYKSINKNLILGKNKYVKNKYCAKISFISDSNGIPIYCSVYNGAINDAIIGSNDINSFNVGNKKIKYMLADKGYDTKNL